MSSGAQIRGRSSLLDDYDMVLKVVMIGDSSVGKSSLLLRFAEGFYQDNFIATIGVDFRIKNMEIEGKRIKLQVWDTAGQDRFKTVTTQFYRSAHAVIIVYDVTNPTTFKNVETWMKEVRSRCPTQCLVYLIGNKSDYTSMRKISTEQGKALADSLDVPYLETSAKTDTNVTQLFTSMTRELYDKYGAELMREHDSKKLTINPEPYTTRGTASSKPAKKLGYLNCLDCNIM